MSISVSGSGSGSGGVGPRGPKGDPGNTTINLTKDVRWGYPTQNAVALVPITSGQSIALKSSGGASLRWHIRDGGRSVADYQVNILSVNDAGTDGNQVTFNITTQDVALPTEYHYYISIDAGDSRFNGRFIATASTVDTITFDYTGNTQETADTYDRTGLTGNLNLPSVYNQVQTSSDGVYIKIDDWTENYQNNYWWQFKNDGSISFPYQTSNSRTGSGEVLQFGQVNQQSIITGPTPDQYNPTASRLVVAGQDGYADSTGEGGDIYLWAGRGGSAGGTGGDIKVDAGNGSGAGEGGTIKIRGGYSPTGTGGFINIEGGNGGTAGGPVGIYSYNTAPITLSGAGGEFLNDSSVANNQIATIGDIAAGTNTYDILYTTHNGDGQNVKIGDDTWLGDINVANTLSIRGVEDAASGYISFGSSAAKNIGSDGSGKTLIGTDLLPSVDNEYVLGNSDYRWKSISVGEGTIYITDATTRQEVALTVDNGIFLLDGIAQAQLPSLITNNIELHDGNDNVVLRLVEESGTGKLYFGGGTNGIWQDSGKTYITGIAYAAQSAGIKPLSYNSSTGEISYNSNTTPLTFMSSIPAHDYGAAGDIKNMFSYDNTYLYMCIADYVNDSTVIWKRINWAGGNW